MPNTLRHPCRKCMRHEGKQTIGGKRLCNPCAGMAKALRAAKLARQVRGEKQ